MTLHAPRRMWTNSRRYVCVCVYVLVLLEKASDTSSASAYIMADTCVWQQARQTWRSSHTEHVCMQVHACTRTSMYTDIYTYTPACSSAHTLAHTLAHITHAHTQAMKDLGLGEALNDALVERFWGIIHALGGMGAGPGAAGMAGGQGTAEPSTTSNRPMVSVARPDAKIPGLALTNTRCASTVCACISTFYM